MSRYEHAGQFWTIEIVGAMVLERLGKIGTPGKKRGRFHGTGRAAAREAKRLRAEMTAQGYKRVTTASRSKTRPARPARPRSSARG